MEPYSARVLVLRPGYLKATYTVHPEGITIGGPLSHCGRQGTARPPVFGKLVNRPHSYPVRVDRLLHWSRPSNLPGKNEPPTSKSVVHCRASQPPARCAQSCVMGLICSNLDPLPEGRGSKRLDVARELVDDEPSPRGRRCRRAGGRGPRAPPSLPLGGSDKTGGRVPEGTHPQIWSRLESENSRAQRAREIK